MFVSDPTRCRVVLAVVAYGVTERLTACLEALVSHSAEIDFGVVCVVNRRGHDAEPVEGLPAGIRVVTPSTNLGWPGGLHAARAEAAGADHLVWVQDDMVVLDGWLDALVDAADANPGAGAFGSVGVGDDGMPDAFSAGAALPVDDIDLWNDTDTTRDRLPEEPTVFDWVTSKGMLVRLAAWDEVGGPDPALFPLNHVDKEFCSHLRCHGWTSMLVPDARLRHAGNSSSPGPLRWFLPGWRSAGLNERWAGPLGALGTGNAAEVDHPCRRDERRDVAEASLAATEEAARMIVPFNRYAKALLAEREAALGEREAARVAADARTRAVAAERDAALAAIEEIRRSTSWRLTKPIRAIGGLRRRTR